MIRKTPERKGRSKKAVIPAEVITEMIQNAATLAYKASDSKDPNESLAALKNLRLDGLKASWKIDFLGRIATHSPYRVTRLAAIERIEMEMRGPCNRNASLAQVARNSTDFEDTGLVALAKMTEDQYRIYYVAASKGPLKIRLEAINRLLTISKTQNLDSIWNGYTKLELAFNCLELIATHCEDKMGRVHALAKLGTEVRIPERERPRPEHRKMQQKALAAVACNSPYESTRESALSLIDGIVELATIFNASRFKDTREAAREKMLKIAG